MGSLSSHFLAVWYLIPTFDSLDSHTRDSHSSGWATTFHQSDWRACCEFVLQAPQNATIRGCHQATLLHLAHESFPLIPHRDRQDRTCVPKTPPPPKKSGEIGTALKIQVYIKARFICRPAISCLFHVDSFFEDLVQITRLENSMLNSLGCKIVRSSQPKSATRRTHSKLHPESITSSWRNLTKLVQIGHLPIPCWIYFINWNLNFYITKISISNLDLDTFQRKKVPAVDIWNHPW